ncbi:hypothetical protein IMX07_14625 [bacterium]|nr:hypothetical protein [bacterium]
MPSILDRIFDAKRAEVAERRARTPLDEMVAEARRTAAPRDFIGSLRSRAPAIIAEVKAATRERTGERGPPPPAHDRRADRPPVIDLQPRL